MAMDESVFQEDLVIDAAFEQPVLDDWRRLAERALRGAPLDDLVSETHEGLRIRPLYTAENVQGLDEPRPNWIGRATQRWAVCQQHRYPNPAIAARHMAEDTARGTDSVWVVFDRGCGVTANTDGVQQVDEPGGVIVGTVDDLVRLFDAIDLSTVRVHLDGGGLGHVYGAAFLAAARRRGVDPALLAGAVGYDPLGSLAAEGVLEQGIERALAVVPDLVAWTEANAAQTKALTVSSIPYTLAGATAVQELAFSLATGVEYLRRLTESGVELPVAVRQFEFRTAVGRDLFMAVAKIRVLRRLWARVVEACGGGPDDRATRVHAVTSTRSLTVTDPWVNILRATVECFAAVTGGADVITVLPFDSAIGPSDELARRLAANTHAILRDESHLAAVTDPAAGSWYVEYLTDELSHGAWSLFQRIESHGGLARALTDGLIREMLAEALDRKRRAVAGGEDPITGVSSYPNPDEIPLRRDPVDTRDLRARASASAVDRRVPSEEIERLSALAESPRRDGSLMSAAISAASAGATVIEVAAALRGDGGPTRIEPLATEREEEAFEGHAP
jgi:methylmalonyl-CoA mutase